MFVDFLHQFVSLRCVSGVISTTVQQFHKTVLHCKGSTSSLRFLLYLYGYISLTVYGAGLCSEAWKGYGAPDALPWLWITNANGLFVTEYRLQSYSNFRNVLKFPFWYYGTLNFLYKLWISPARNWNWYIPATNQN